MFTIGEPRPNCDANKPQEDAQGTRQIRRGRLNNETPEQRERRLYIQCEQRRKRRKPQSKDKRQHHFESTVHPALASHVFLVYIYPWSVKKANKINAKSKDEVLKDSASTIF